MSLIDKNFKLFEIISHGNFSPNIVLIAGRVLELHYTKVLANLINLKLTEMHVMLITQINE